MDTNLVEMMQKFNSEDRCREYIEALRWPSGICCTRCGSLSVSKIAKRHQYDCNDCRYQFSPMAGTVFHDSHLPLTKWFLAVYLMCESKKGISACQIQRTLGIGYKAAWYLCHRIREAMKTNTSEKLKGIVEADETFVGGRYDKRRKRPTYEKPCVVGVIERGGEVRAQKIPSRGARAISGFIKESVEPGARLMTDEYAGYHKVGREYDHAIINHSKLEYAAGLVHTNSIENFWSLFKRGVIGSFHKVSEKHLDRYLDEFTYRFNGREDERLFQNTIRNLVNGKTLTFEKLTKTA
ncbi:MAG: IS1595 family transposase [Ktedonobacteraceae bacterium]